MGFFTSWATPRVRRPLAERRRDISISSPMRRTDSGSRMIRRAPICEFFSCTKSSETCTRFPPAASNSRWDKGRRRSKASSRAVPRRECAVKYLLNGASQKFRARTAQKPFHRRADQHHARVAREQHQAILQLGHELVDVVLEGGEDFPAVANLAAQVGNFQR